MGDQAHRPAGVILVRHAAPRIEPDRPSTDWLLSDDGRASAAALAGRLIGLDMEAVASSPEPKAVETAEILAVRLGLAVEIEPGLVEHRRASVGFQAREAFEAGIARLFTEPSRRVFGEETADEAHDRFAASLSERRLIVAHGTVISLYVARRMGLDTFAFWKGLAMPEALILDAEGGLRRIAP